MVAVLLASGAAVNQARTVGVVVLRVAGRFAVRDIDLRCCGFVDPWATLVL